MRLGMEPQSVDYYRAATASSPPVSLRRRKCKCGVTVTAKQLQQYGMCDKCRRGQ